jgi:hypothetical protein
MSRASFRQADIERLIRAAAKTSSVVQVDLRSLIVTIIPGAAAHVDLPKTFGMAPDGKENWDE